jgi:hypothetical protein
VSPTKTAWYAARAVFLHKSLRPSRGKERVFEERIVLLRAVTERAAIREAQREARRYARTTTGVDYVGFVETFRLFESRLRSGSEVFSLMRSTTLSPSRFVSRYFDDGTERRRK